MPVIFQLKQLLHEDVKTEGKLTPEELSLPEDDECIKMTENVNYTLAASRQGSQVWIIGKINFTLDCICVRCLSSFKMPIEIQYSEFFTLEGEESIPIKDDSIDLTNYIREDILLNYPQHPLCDRNCNRFAHQPVRNRENKRGSDAKSESVSLAWSELDKLKLD